MQPIKKMLEGCPLTAIPSKPKIKYCKKVNHTTDNASGTNESTNRTDIYHGIYKNLNEYENKLKAFIRRYESAEIDDNAKTTLRELATLRHGQNLHENFVRYFGMEEENNFSYVAIEWCICSVEDLYRKGGNETNWIGETINVADIKKSLVTIEILLQSTKGLEFLHCKEKKVHRNIKPSNFLISQVGRDNQPGNKYKVKLSDFCLSKIPKDMPEQSIEFDFKKKSEAWIALAPGLEKGKEHTLDEYFAFDVFCLGTFFYFVLTEGDHPFDNVSENGEVRKTREERILNEKDSVYSDKWNPRLQTSLQNNLEENKQAVDILKKMIKFKPEDRCRLNEVLNCDFFPKNWIQIPSKSKIKYCTKPTKHKLGGANDSTNCTSIYQGIYENKETLKVFIRRYEQGRHTEVLRDLAALQHGQNLHENFIRYFGMEEEKNFSYVATEWCICSVEDLYGKLDINRKNDDRFNWIGEMIDVTDINKSLGPKQILLQATKGLEYLHCKEKKVHRNIKPSNFLIAQVGGDNQLDNKYKVKLSDFCLSKVPKDMPEQSFEFDFTKKWIALAPGLEKGKEHTLDEYFAFDVFCLGTFFYFVLTKGDHPFDNVSENVSIDKIPKQMEERIFDENDEVYSGAWKPRLQETNEQAVFLLKQMIKFNPDERYKLNQVLDSHYFLSEDYYQLYDKPGGVKPGLCIIFNQEIFDDPFYNRRGTRHDEVNLIYVFKLLGFDVEIFRNLKANDLLYYIDELTRRDFIEYASLIVCILSHGDENVVKGTDSINLNIDELKYKFNSNNCNLNGKPKIWIIQACQGLVSQKPLVKTQQSDTAQYNNTSGLNPSAAADNINPSSSLSTLNRSESDGTRISMRHHQQKRELPLVIKTNNAANNVPQDSTRIDSAPFMDFIEIRASIPGFLSFRSPFDGSLLVRNLCNELEGEYLSKETPPKKSKDLEDVLNRVQDKISKETKFITPDETDKTQREYVKQTIVRNVSLNGKIKFRKARIGMVTKRRSERVVKNNWTCLDRFLYFISTPVHHYGKLDKFDREMLINFSFLTFLLWTMWSSFDFLSQPNYFLCSFIIVLFRDVRRGLLALFKFTFLDLFYKSSYWEDRFGHQYPWKIFVLPSFLWVMWSLFSLFIPSVNYSFLNFLVFFNCFDIIVCNRQLGILLKNLQHLAELVLTNFFLFFPYVAIYVLFKYDIIKL